MQPPKPKRISFGEPRRPDPTPAEIRARAAAIRSEWSDCRYDAPQRWEAPEVRTPRLR